MRISELNLGENIKRADSEIEFTSICRNTNEISEDCLFFDLPSVSGKQRSYAFSIAPRAIITENPTDFAELNLPIIEVKDARSAYAYAYSSLLKIDYSKFKIIGVTGTNGKSSVCAMLKKILTAFGKKCGLIGTGIIDADGEILSRQYYSMTTPDPEILYPTLKKMQEQKIEYILMEVSSHALALGKCAPIEFDIGVFTGLSPEHLDFHKTLENYYCAKRTLFTKARLGVIFTDGEYGERLFAEFKDRSVSVGIGSGMIKAESIHQRGFSGSDFTLSKNGKKYSVLLRVPGLYNINNALLALGCISELSLDIKRAIEALYELTFIKGRFEVIQSDITVIRDFAHTEEALRNLLKTIKSNVNTGQNITVVMGCGGERDKSKRPFMAKCASELSDRVVITEDNSRGEELSEILSDIIFGIDSGRIGVIADRALAIEYAIATAKDSEVVVIVGKGAEDYIITKQTYRHFDERGIIEAALSKRISKRSGQ